ncbi:MAG: enoyl-CoA hydratase-related protein [Myxococcota bacterium]
MAYVTYEKRDHIATITLNRPDRLNAFGRELRQQLNEAETQFAEDDDAWVAIYTGAGDRAFSAGLDLKEAATAAPQGGRSGAPRRRGFPDQAKPTLAAVNGVAYGGGTELALSCDIRICSENAVFALSEVKVGLCPPSGSLTLPRLIGLSNAMWLLLSGEPVDAQEALRMGLVTRVVPQAELLPTATKMAEIICQNAPLAVRATKQLAKLGLEVPLEYAQMLLAGTVSSVWGSEDAVEGARAFAEKRPPAWKMR